MKKTKKQAYLQEDGERKAKLSLAQAERELLTGFIMGELFQLDNVTEIADGYLLANRIGQKLERLDEINREIEELSKDTEGSTEKSNSKDVIN